MNQRNDALGNPLNIGDHVVFVVLGCAPFRKRDMEMRRGTVAGFTKSDVLIESYWLSSKEPRKYKQENHLVTKLFV